MFQPVRGTRDLLPKEYRQHQYIIETSRKLAANYGYTGIDTPMFEFSQVFSHMGETTDVVTKETYTFTDRGDQEITLRPEGTAGVVRSVISNGLTQQVPLKYFYAGPMFRYERPQKGRYRQLHQIGVELLGVPQTLGDVEIIALGQHILNALDLRGEIVLEINSLGDTESRNNYRRALLEYLQDYRDQLSQDSKRRLERNPLRILDSKDEGDIAIIQNAPQYREHLNAKSEDIFADVLKQLDSLGIAYNLNYRIVRGLDYYCHTTFEFVSNELGAQGTVLAGGRYDGLVKIMGGPEMAGVGWAAGVDRLALLLDKEIATKRPIVIIPIGEEAESKALMLSQELRNLDFCVELGYSGNLSKRMKKANKVNARFAIIFGEEEMKDNKLSVRDFDSGDQTVIEATQISDFLKQQGC